MCSALTDQVHAKIKQLGEEGDRLARDGKDKEALDKYYDAWDLVPGNKQDWECSTWILASMGEIFLKHQKFDKAQHAFRSAVQCPDGLANPYIHLRLGEIALEKGELDEAADELGRAYMGGGVAIFANENPKYIEFLRTRMVLD